MKTNSPKKWRQPHPKRGRPNSKIADDIPKKGRQPYPKTEDDLTQKSIFCIFFFKNALDCIIFWLKLTTFCNFWQKMTVCVQKITNFGKKWPFFLTKHTQNLCKNKPTSSKIYQYLTVAFLLPQLVSVCSQGKKDKFLTKKIDHFCYFFFKNWLNLPKNTSFWIIFFLKLTTFCIFWQKWPFFVIYFFKNASDRPKNISFWPLLVIFDQKWPVFDKKLPFLAKKLPFFLTKQAQTFVQIDPIGQIDQKRKMTSPKNWRQPLPKIKPTPQKENK